MGRRRARAGGRRPCLEREREQFVQQLPELLAQAKRLGIDKETLLQTIKNLKEQP